MDVATTGLVVIDMQNGFVNERSRHVVPVIERLIQTWQAAGGEAVFTCFWNHPGSPYERLIHWSKMQEPPETDIVSELAPFVSNVIDKEFYSFFTDEATKLIADKGWSSLMFCGIATDSCILKSAVDAFERNITPWVIKDACASHAGDEVHQKALHIIGRFIGGGQLMNVDELDV